MRNALSVGGGETESLKVEGDGEDEVWLRQGVIAVSCTLEGNYLGTGAMSQPHGRT